MKMNRYSLELTRRVWISTLPPGINKMVLLAYCLHVNDHTGVCWPSVSRLAAMTGMAPRTVQRHIRALEAAGILKAHSATAITRVYKLSLHGLTECPALMKPAADVPGDIFDTDPVDNFAQWGDIFDTDPCQFGQKGVAICTETPVRMSPKLYELNRTDEGTDHAAPTPTASPASRSSATPPVYRSVFLQLHFPRPFGDGASNTKRSRGCSPHRKAGLRHVQISGARAACRCRGATGCGQDGPHRKAGRTGVTSCY